MSSLAPPPATPGPTPTSTSSTALPPQTPTTEFAVFEAQKENIQPLTTGRSAAVLGGLYNKEKAEAERVVREGHERCRKEIEEAERREAEGEEMVEGTMDVLDPYCKYIAFINQHHPSSPLLLLPILESTTRKFISDPRFSQDARYLRLWSQYAKLVDVDMREDVWGFLNSREVGTVWSGFYEDWAGCCEARGRHQQALEIYKLGIARKAQPLKRLQQQYQAFLTRPPVVVPASTSVGPTLTSGSIGGNGNVPVVSGRRVLGSRVPSGPGSGGLSGGGSGIASSSGSGSSQARPANGSRLDVFSDTPNPSSSTLTASSESLPWAELGTASSNRKENEREATGWKGEMLKQDKRAMARVVVRTPRLEVFSDEPEPRSRSTTEESSVPGTRNKSSTDAEALRSNPLRFYTDLLPMSSTVSLPPIPGSTSAPTTSEPTTKSKTRKPSSSSSCHVLGAPWTIPDRQPEPGAKGKPEKRMFVWEEVFWDGEEWSFEEIRARGMGLGEVRSRDKDGDEGSESEVDEWEKVWHVPGATGPPAPIPELQSATPPIGPIRLPVFTDSAPIPVQFDSPAPSSPPMRSVQPPKSAYSGHRAPPSPTVNTKAAMADVMEMLNQDLKGGKGAIRASSEDDSDEDDESSSDEEEEDEDDAKATRVHVPQPTPRTAISAPVQARMGLSTPGGFIPPTPTPAQGYLSSRRDPSLGVFTDQNVQPPPSTIKLKVFQDDLSVSDPPPRMMVFSDEAPAVQKPRLSVFSDENAIPGPSTAPNAIGVTPAKGRTPFGSRTPLSMKPVAVADIAEEVARPMTQETNTIEDRASAFATPIRPVQRVKMSRAPNVFAPMGSSAEGMNEDEGDVPEGEELYEYQEEIDRPSRQQRQVMALGRQFNAMTPITERTYEYTSSTIANGLRSSTSSALTAGTRNFSRGLDSDDEANGRQTDEDDDGLPPPPVAARATDLSMVKEESEHTSTTTGQQSQRAVTRSPSPTIASSASGRSPSAFERSGTIDSPFRLPAGYTIQHQPELLATQSPSRPATAVSGPVASEDVTCAPSTTSVPPNPCTPTDPEVMTALLQALYPPLTDLSGFVDLRTRDGNHLAQLQKTAKSRGLSASTKSRSSEPWLIELGSKQYELEEKIGEGGFGAVFKAIDLEARDIADDASDCGDDDDMEDQFVVAIKVERPANVWESVILDRMRSRLTANSAASVIKSRGLYCYNDESMLLLDYHSQGTLLDAVNKAPSLGIAPTSPGAIPSMDELPAVFFAIELLKVVEDLHRADFIHGDLKIDNCLVRLSGSDSWSAQYDRTGGNGWAKKGVRLIDFGRAADMQMYPAGRAQEFIADWTTDERDCPEMRAGKPWSYQTDYCGLASICYCMLFGKYIATEEATDGASESGGKRFKISGTLKRYWQTELWNELFDLLLNSKLVRTDGALPIVDELAVIRHKFEDWLEANCQKNGKNLKSMLTKVEMANMR